MLGSILTAVALAAPASPPAAGLIYTAPLHDVVSQSDLIVHALLDLVNRRVKILRTIRGVAPGETVDVHNLREFAPSLPFASERPLPSQAFLFLQELDGRLYLTHARTPKWITPHSCIYAVATDDTVLGYRQMFNPGPLSLVKTHDSVRAFEEVLRGLLAAHPARARLPASKLTRQELTRFYALIDEYVDFYRREAVRPGEAEASWSRTTVVDLEPASVLERFVEKLEHYVVTSDGEARRRGIEALLILGEQSGPEQRRRAAVERRLLALLDQTGAEPFIEPLLAELGSRDIYANKATAARVLRRIAGAPADRGEKILRALVISGKSTLRSRSYWALRYLGRAAAAETALREAQAKSKEQTRK